MSLETVIETGRRSVLQTAPSSRRKGTAMDRSMRRPSKRKDSTQYRLMFAVCVTVFLVAAVISRLLPWNWRFVGDEVKRKSVVEEAMEAANTVLPYAFMS
jgi:hypothetical protein